MKMRFVCLGSGSKGNCYLIENDNECLVLDAGISSKEVKKALDFNVLKISGVCITHEHMDHLKYGKDYEHMGIPVWKPYEGGKQSAQFGRFKVWAVPVPHDDVECRAFLVQHPDMGKLLYLTDLEYCPLTFKTHRVNHILVEANYSRDLMDSDRPNWEHVMRGHQSLDGAIKFVETNKTDNLQNVIMCHMSQVTGDKDYFIEQMEKAVSCPVYVAERGLCIILTGDNNEQSATATTSQKTANDNRANATATH